MDRRKHTIDRCTFVTKYKLTDGGTKTHLTGETLPPRLTHLPGQWLQCQANGSNVCRVQANGSNAKPTAPTKCLLNTSGYLEKLMQTPMAQGRSTKVISTIKWIRTISLSIKNDHSANRGWTGPDGAACTICPIGTFKGVVGSSDCLPAPLGTAVTHAMPSRTVGLLA